MTRSAKGVAGSMLVVIALGIWYLRWIGRPPMRPSVLPANAVYIETGVVPFKLRFTPGHWVRCWYEQNDRLNHCKVTNEIGNLEFEDVFLAYDGGAPASKSDLVLDHRTGTRWTGDYSKGINVPVVYLANGRILLPRTIFDKAKKDIS